MGLGPSLLLLPRHGSCNTLTTMDSCGRETLEGRKGTQETERFGSFLAWHSHCHSTHTTCHLLPAHTRLHCTHAPLCTCLATALHCLPSGQEGRGQVCVGDWFLGGWRHLITINITCCLPAFLPPSSHLHPPPLPDRAGDKNSQTLTHHLAAGQAVAWPGLASTWPAEKPVTWWPCHLHHLSLTSSIIII